MAVDAVSGSCGFFASKVKRIPLVSQFANASGAFFVLVGGLTWLSVSKLDANTVFVSETWFRWSDEASFEYEVYRVSYAIYKDSSISVPQTSPTVRGDFNE